MSWRSVPLETVATINPKRPRNLGLADVDLVSFVPMQAVSEVTARIERLDSRPFEETKKGFTYFQNGDVLFAKITPCMENGKSAIAESLSNNAGFGSTEFHVIRPNTGCVIAKWLHYFVRRADFRSQAKDQMRGAAGQQRVPKDFLENAKLPLPTVKEQHRIVEILDQADRLRQLRREADAKAERILPALFVKMFGDPAANPLDWPLRPLQLVIEAIDSGWSAKSLNRVKNHDERGVLKVSAVTSGYFKPDENKAVTGVPEDRKLVSPRRGDLLFSRANTRELVAATCIVEEGYPDLFLPDKLWCITPKRGEATPRFLRQLFATNAVRDQFRSRATGSSGSMLNISQSAVLATRVPIPPYELQVKFSGIAQRLADIRAGTLPAREKIETLNQSLLRRAFTGDLTAQWREAHMSELLVEMEQQARALDLPLPTPEPRSGRSTA